MSKTRATSRRYAPIAAILAAVATLILLLVIYTSRNLALSRQRLEDSLLQEGLTLIRAIEAGNRTGMRMHWALPHLQALVEEIGNAPKVAYISVIGTDGLIIAHTQPEAVGQAAGIDPELFKNTASPYHTTTIQTADGVDVFDILAKTMSPGTPSPVFDPAQERSIGMGHGMGMGRGMGRGAQTFTNVAAIQLGLKMSELRQLQQRDLRNAVLMLAVLSVAGAVALYVIVVLQNYATVNYAFQTMQSYTQHVVDSMANGLISLDNDGKIVTLNRQAHHLLDLPAHKLVQNMTLPELMTLPDFDVCAALEQGKPVIDQELLCTTASQRTLPISLTASRLEDDAGEQLGTVLLFRDLSEVRTLQEQVKRSERLASVGRLAAGVAHEIRNPLSSLKGFLQYFQRKLTLPEQDQTYLTVMMNEVDRLNTVISNLLDFARPKEPVLEACHLPDIVQHVLTLLEGDMQAKALAIALQLPDDLPPIMADRDQITQVVLNIVLNAIQSMETGGSLQIAAHLLTDTHYIELTISDTGTGIAPEDLPKIFDPFFTTKKKGAGLGLAIAYTIVEHHHGELTVASEVGKGTTFRMRLPI